MIRSSRKKLLQVMLLVVALLLPSYTIPSNAQPSTLPTTFTYQGYLENASGPVNGLCSFQFSLYDASIAGNQIGITNTLIDLPISGGVFTAVLDFGAGAFTGGTRYLEIAVMCAGDAGFTTLTPRQGITPAPYSTYAATAGSVDWNAILNIPAGFADGIDNDSGLVDLTPYYLLDGSRPLAGTMNAAGNAIINLPLAVGNGQPVVFQQAVKGGDAAGGDLTGSYPSPQISRLQGLPVSALNPNPNDVLLWNGGTWVAAPISSAAGWQLNGNTGTSTANFIGTTDNQLLQFRVNNQIVLRLIPDAISPNIIGGFSANTITPGVVGSFIGGGGANGISGDNPNIISDNYSVIGGGSGNTAGNNNTSFSDADYATIGGGFGNTASEDYATIGGGQNNVSSNLNSVVAGGFSNTASGPRSTVGGGQSNEATNQFATIAGGGANDATGLGSFVGGGRINQASGLDSMIGGGNNNTADSLSTVISGGERNRALGNYAAILGGFNNDAFGTASIIGGGQFNIVYDNYGIIVGGESNQAGANDINSTTQTYAVVVGGANNIAASTYSFVGGGNVNVASGMNSFVGGGNTNDAINNYSTVGGGFGNTAGNPVVVAPYTTVAGGRNNTAGGSGSTVSGGDTNLASGELSVISGGNGNQTTTTGLYATIAGGDGNSATRNHTTVGGGSDNAAEHDHATIAGGSGNLANGPFSTVGGGHDNSATDFFTTVSGGEDNTASNDWATVSGGENNTASGRGATVPGGVDNAAQGDYSFAAGYNTGATDGAFVWGGGTSTTQLQAASNTFVASAPGGFWFGNNRSPGVPAGRLINTSSGAYLTTGGTWTNNSDANLKTNFESVDTVGVLEALVNIPITTWSYLEETEQDVKRMGPMAQDFYAAFGVGGDNTHISTVDADGVALAAIQGLYEIVQEKDSRITVLETENALLLNQNTSFEARLNALEANGSAGNTTLPILWLLAGGLVMAGGLTLLRRREVLS